MGRMIRNEGTVIRPRKSTNWTSDSLKPRKVPIFKIGENDFALNVPHGQLGYNYYTNEPGTTKPPQLLNEAPSEVKKSVMSQLERYCENTTLHGLRYVGDSHLTFGERIFWFISFSLAIGFAAYYISNIYAKWKSSPVIISFSPFDAQLSSIPFPAITICNMNQAKKSEAEKILKEGSNTEKKLLDDSCNGNASFDNTENISWESLRDFLVKVGNSCSDMLKSCQWGSDKINCDEAFNNDLTDEGLCCSFNRLPPEKIFRNMKDISILNQTYPSNVYDWNAEKGFEGTDYTDFIPRKPLGAGAHLGLSVVLDAQIDNYYCSSTRSTGFKVILSNPIETPKMADFGFLISPGFETRITIEPSVREATSSLREVPIEKRQCYFANERPLQYYRMYSMKHCSMECHSKSSLIECGCIPYYLPRNSSKNVKICHVDDKCADRAKEIIEEQEGHIKYIKGTSIICDCIHSCCGIEYYVRRSSSPLHRFPAKVPIIKSKNYTAKYKRSYTQLNCLEECHSNISIRRCQCIPYYLPKNIYTSYCGVVERKCTIEVKTDVDDLKNGSFLDGECICKPACFEISYKHSISGSPILSSALGNNRYGNNTNSLTVATFLFREELIQRQVKDLLFGFSEILSNVGGILSLCLGISFLSVIELFYYASLRLLCMYAKKRRKEKKKREQVRKKQDKLVQRRATLNTLNLHIAHI